MVEPSAPYFMSPTQSTQPAGSSLVPPQPTPFTQSQPVQNAFPQIQPQPIPTSPTQSFTPTIQPVAHQSNVSTPTTGISFKDKLIKTAMNIVLYIIFFFLGYIVARLQALFANI